MAEKNTHKETTPVAKRVAKKTKANAAKPASAKPASTKQTTANKRNAAPAPKAAAAKSQAAATQQTTTQPPVAQSAPRQTTAAPVPPTAAPVAINDGTVVVKSGRGLSTLALLCSLAALGLSGYLVYQHTIKSAAGSTSLAVGLTEIKGNVGRIGDVVTNLQSNVQSLGEKQSAFTTDDAVAKQVTQQLAQKIDPIVEQQAALNQTVQQVRQQVSGDDSQYVFDRVRRLLEAANTELNLSGNVNSSVQALTIAADQIKALNNNSLDVVRGKILADIEALAAIEKPDLSGISTKLLAMQATVENWPLQNEPNAEVIKIESEATAVEPAGGFVNEVKRMAAEMVRGAVQVQKVDAAPKPLLAPEQRYFLNQNLRLQLLTAQNALLQQESVIYKSNLEGASAWIKEYFDPADARVQKALNDLASLSAVNLNPSLHDISGTLKSFDDVANSSTSQR